MLSMPQVFEQSLFLFISGQVLGPGVQQGDPALPRPPLRCVHAGAAPNYRRAGE